jgi:hypothetical protein
MIIFLQFSIGCWNCPDSVIYIFSFYYSFILMSGCVGMGPSALLFPYARKLPSSQINLHCLSAEISKHQRYRSILHV